MYYVLIEQSDSFMSDKPTYLSFKNLEITEFKTHPKCYTQIGKYPDYTYCRQLVIYPSGLSFPIYCSEKDKHFDDFLLKLNESLKTENRIIIELSLKELRHTNYQQIKIIKM